MRQTNTALNTTPVVVLRALKPGEVVLLPDGERAMVVEQKRDQVLVVQPQKMVGRGPWWFHRFQLDEAA